MTHQQTGRRKLIDQTALLKKLIAARDEYAHEHFIVDPETGALEGSAAKEEYLRTLDEQIEFIQAFPSIEISESAPKVSDNDAGEITVSLDGKELRGWSYKDDAERRLKMTAAHEFAEGWFQARTALARSRP